MSQYASPYVGIIQWLQNLQILQHFNAYEFQLFDHQSSAFTYKFKGEL